MDLTITPLREAHFEQLRAVADRVAREGRFLAMTEAPSLDEATAFYRTVVAEAQCSVAVVDSAVVGWCDVLPLFGQRRSHAGTLGMGLLPDYRGRGIGSRLLATAIETAWRRGLTRIELTVRDDNAAARALYQRYGFRYEGLLRQSMVVDGNVYLDCHAMALLHDDGDGDDRSPTGSPAAAPEAA